MHSTASEYHHIVSQTWNQQYFDNFFLEIQSQLNNTAELSSFAELIHKRKKEIMHALPEIAYNNLATLFEHPQVIQYVLHSSISTLPKFWHYIEIMAIERFGNILACWAAYERFLILQRNQGLSFTTLPTPPMDENSYQSEIVDHIETDHRLFLTLHSHIALTLSDAISLINLDVFIIGQKWYEMLFCLHLSQRGSHFILYHTGNYPHPLLVSTALIQHWHERDNWLTFDPFFQGNGWHSCLSSDIGIHLYKTGIFHPQIVQFTDYDSESAFSLCIKDTKAICEILRFSTSGSNHMRLFFLYIGQKYLMKELVKYGKTVSFTIIEQQALLYLYDALDSICYLKKNCYDIVRGTVTYQGFLLNDILLEELTNCDYKKYKSLIIKQRKR